MNFRIAIPTIARAETIKKKTINYLAQTDIDFKKIDLFLSDGNELQAYQESLKDYPINYIVTNQKHVNTQRNFIVNHYKEGDLILGIDDDIQNIQIKLTDKKTMVLTDLVQFVEQAFEISLAKKLPLWAVRIIVIDLRWVG